MTEPRWTVRPTYRNAIVRDDGAEVLCYGPFGTGDEADDDLAIEVAAALNRVATVEAQATQLADAHAVIADALDSKVTGGLWPSDVQTEATREVFRRVAAIRRARTPGEVAAIAAARATEGASAKPRGFATYAEPGAWQPDTETGEAT